MTFDPELEARVEDIRQQPDLPDAVLTLLDYIDMLKDDMAVDDAVIEAQVITIERARLRMALCSGPCHAPGVEPVKLEEAMYCTEHGLYFTNIPGASSEPHCHLRPLYYFTEPS